MKTTLVWSLLMLVCNLSYGSEAMAPVAEAYRGTKQLQVDVAYTSQGDHALVKITRVNHSWNNQIIRARLRSGAHERKEFVISHDGKEYVLMIFQSAHAGTLYLPGQPEMPVFYQHERAQQLNPAHIQTEWAAQKN